MVSLTSNQLKTILYTKGDRYKVIITATENNNPFIVFTDCGCWKTTKWYPNICDWFALAYDDAENRLYNIFTILIGHNDKKFTSSESSTGGVL